MLATRSSIHLESKSGLLVVFISHCWMWQFVINKLSDSKSGSESASRAHWEGMSMPYTALLIWSIPWSSWCLPWASRSGVFNPIHKGPVWLSFHTSRSHTWFHVKSVHLRLQSTIKCASYLVEMKACSHTGTLWIRLKTPVIEDSLVHKF